jgi:phosphotransferase system HPr (HPr) family protein
VVAGTRKDNAMTGRMTEASPSKRVTVINSQGLHARPADQFVRLAKQFHSTIEVEMDGELVDGKSILSILTLAATQGSELTIRASGDDAEEAVEALVEFIESDSAV